MDLALRTFEGFQRSIRCFEKWLGGTGVGAMDIDALIERNHKFLVIEGKPWKGSGVAVPYGSHLCLTRLAALPGFRVLLVGEQQAGADTTLYLTDYAGGKPHVGKYEGRMEAWWGEEWFEQTNVAGLRKLVKEWWREASASAAA